MDYKYEQIENAIKNHDQKIVAKLLNDADYRNFLLSNLKFDNLLYLAIDSEDLVITEAVIKAYRKQGSINTNGSYENDSFVMKAVMKNNPALVELLIKQNFKVDLICKPGILPLTRAVKNNNENIVKLILNKLCDQNQTNNQEPLSASTCIIMNKATIGSKNTDHEYEQNNSLQFAAKESVSPKIFELLLQHIDESDLLRENGAGKSAATLVLESGNKDKIELVITRLSEQSIERLTHYAAGHCGQEALSLLVGTSTKMADTYQDNMLPLHKAIINSKHDNIRYLLPITQADAEIDGLTPLELALRQPNLTDKTLDIFFEREEFSLDPNDSGFTILHNIAIGGSKEGFDRVKIKLTAADKTIIDNQTEKDKKSALIFAIENEHYEIALNLIENGANLSLTDSNKENALHIAARNDDTRIIRKLIEQNPSLQFTTNNSNQTPFQIAKDRKANQNILEVFNNEYGASYRNKVIMYTIPTLMCLTFLAFSLYSKTSITHLSIHSDIIIASSITLFVIITAIVDLCFSYHTPPELSPNLHSNKENSSGLDQGHNNTNEKNSNMRREEKKLYPKTGNVRR